MATEIARQEVDGRASADRENKRECTNDDEDRNRSEMMASFFIVKIRVTGSL